MNNCSNNELTKLHGVLLEMLDEFDRICRKHNISYFLDSGSALGAIRHGGFIPWDDDLDIGMLRSDYEHFLEVAKTELNDKYVIQTHENEPLYINFHAKIRKLNTVFPQSYTSDFKYRGFQLDIFPFDLLPSDKNKANKAIDKARRFRKIYDFAATKFHHSLKTCIPQLILKILLWKWSRNYYEYLCQRYNNENSKNVTCFTYQMIKKGKKFILNYDELMPVKDVKFEDRTYMIMNNPDYYLKKIYGNYMELPPEGQRHYHLIGNMIFDTTNIDG